MVILIFIIPFVLTYTCGEFKQDARKVTAECLPEVLTCLFDEECHAEQQKVSICCKRKLAFYCRNDENVFPLEEILSCFSGTKNVRIKKVIECAFEKTI